MTNKELRHTVPAKMAKIGIKTEIGDDIYRVITDLMTKYSRNHNKNLIEQIKKQEKTIKRYKNKISKTAPHKPKSIYDMPKFR